MIIRVSLLLLAGFFVSNGFPAKEYEEIYPERIHHSRHKRDLSTAAEGYHDDTVTYKVKDYILDLIRSEEIHPGSFLLRTYDDDGNPVHKKHNPEQCYYHGKVRGLKDSNVHLSTCSGLTGTIDTGKTREDIEPLNEDGLHKLYNVDRQIKEITDLLNNDSPVASEIEKYSEKRSTSNDYSTDYSLYNVEPQYIPYLANPNRTRYVEIFVCADHGLYKHYNNDTNKVIERVINTFTHIDKAYQAINIRLVVVAMDVLTAPTFTRFRGGGGDLGSFRSYWNNVIKKTSNFKDIRMDNAQLLSHYRYDHVSGLAYMGGLCSDYSAAVNEWSFESYSGPTYVIGHEFGHNLNFPHDTGKCKCLTPKGCFMEKGRPNNPGFSDCSLNGLRAKTFACIDDKPTTSVKPTCGNGIKEDDEQCDCGTAENCKKSNDHCCQPHGCKLKASAQCSHVNSPGCCSTKCLFQREGTMCRESNGNCDVADYCTGRSAECPANLYRRNGEACGDTAALINGPLKIRETKTKTFKPRIIARYVKIIPKLWRRGGRACTKLEILGCPTVSNDVLRYAPTGIKTNQLYYTGPLCIAPGDYSSCDNQIPDGTKLKYIYLRLGDCNVNYMKFRLTSEGILIHHCSGKKVCTMDDSTLVISSLCEEEKSKFVHTPEKSLKQKSSGMCFNAADSWQDHGDLIKVTSRCIDTRYQRTVLNFLIKDCVNSLGISTHILPDKSFTASSKYYRKYNTSNIRMDKNGWCPLTKTESSWFQVDLLNEMSISTIILKSTEWDWISAYNMMYSTDGNTWITYKEAGADIKAAKSVCYDGKCVGSYDHQCKSLWNGDAKNASIKCWNNLNKGTDVYGTCDPNSKVACSDENLFCGQIQCQASQEYPHYVNYANPIPLADKPSYKKFIMDDNTVCSGARIIGNEEAGLGMVQDGTKCGEGKVCKNQMCKTLAAHNFAACLIVNGKLCNGEICRNDGSCFCTNNMNPADGCKTALNTVAENGGWSKWSEWTVCSHGCNGGKQNRHRFCNQPFANNGGADCVGDQTNEQDCNTEPCPIERSCRALKNKLQKLNKPLYDGVYTVKPKAGTELKVYCDMKRHGGGWTLIVSSDTNSWTEENVKERNKDTPHLRGDYSILTYANMFKYDANIKDSTFEYMLEANDRSRWGGIWTAPSYYNMSSTDRTQYDVKLTTKFDDWEVGSNSISNTLPYINKHCLTTSPYDLDKTQYGSITDNKTGLHPSCWIRDGLKLTFPEYVWYWMREGEYKHPKTCFEIMKRGISSGKKFPNGIYDIEPTPGNFVKTFCEMNRHSGGWTLVTAAITKTGWTTANVGLRNEMSPTNGDYSIYKFIDNIKQQDLAETTFDYMIEANDKDQNGGIFSYSVTPSLMTSPQKGYKLTLIKKFGTWDEATENIGKYPLFPTSLNGCFLKAGMADTSDVYGTIVTTTGSGNMYMKSLKNPSYVKVWVREGGSCKSCNDIAIHGYQKGVRDYTDGYYMLQNLQLVYCDMEYSPKEGWTLLVTSASDKWTRELVLSRNKEKPSLIDNYSILSQANSIKKLSDGKKFKYMLDARQRHHWGGIYEAPIDYVFDFTRSNHPTVKLKQFDEWDKLWWSGVQDVMPWLGDPTHGRALLTTSGYDNYYESGVICANESPLYNKPARWIFYEMTRPGKIWYWINENDCDSDYKKTDGKYTEWSMWTQCVSCKIGKQSRKRMCLEPKPRCGGDRCDPAESIFEEKDCSAECTATRIIDPNNRYCFEPQTGKCSPDDNTPIVLRPTTTHCKDESSKFIYDPQAGVLVHLCSKKRVCASNPTQGENLKVSTSCPEVSLAHAMYRTLYGSIQYGKDMCLDAAGVANTAGLGDNVNIQLWGACAMAKNKFQFKDMAKPSVKMQLYKLTLPAGNRVADFRSNPGYPNAHHALGFVDNFVTTSNIDNNYQVQLSAYFIAPMTGKYRFVAASDDGCEVYLSNKPTEAGSTYDKASMRRIINNLRDTSGRFNWYRWPAQKSEPIELKVGKKYYMEGLMVEGHGDDYFSVGCYLPDGTSLLPITSHYLTSTA